jgi:pullulanase/glycogen debranching enzyme
MYALKSAEYSHLTEKYGDNYLGCTIQDNKTTFRVFAPRSPLIELELFDTYEQKDGRIIPMIRIQSGVWELILDESLEGKLYGYRVSEPKDGLPFEKSDFPVADPYSRWVVVQHNHLQNPKSLIINIPDFDWGDDTYKSPTDPRDLVIYEAHIKDLVTHPNPAFYKHSVYEQFLKSGSRGGIEYLKKLNINALELLPLQKFAYLEPPYNTETAEGITNSWNPYSTNYWGYMTSFFFMPESLYALNHEIKPDEVYGKTIEGIHQLKQIVKALHKEGISVILDVVYNHASQYDRNPLKYLDRNYYFRHDNNQNYTSYSGCGNDLKTEAPMARKLIIDSVLFWMREFHIDGFRFDLANLIDRETVIRIKEEARKINPNVILIAEPWGGGYNPVGFSEVGWPSWNDQIRNGIKGSDPVHDTGLIFGNWQRENSRLSVENYIRGTLLNQPNGRYKRSSHCVNYLESHDGYTLGDFIRIVYNGNLMHQQIPDKALVATLEGPELNSARLAAFLLMISQGVAMIHAGQEFARTKLIPLENTHDPDAGKLDHNSYNKNDSTNYIDFDDIHLNQGLFEYYVGLIRLRRSSAALRKAKPDSISFSHYEDALHITFSIRNHDTKDPFEYYVSINANPYREHEIQLPPGYWQIMVSETVASDVPISVISGSVKIGPLSGFLVRKLSDN